MTDTTTPKQFYCYADDVRHGVTVIAKTHEQAERSAAPELRCNPDYVVARYQKSLPGWRAKR